MSVVSSSVAGSSAIDKLIGSTPTTASVSMPTANTEYSYTLPVGTKYWRLQNRKNGLIRLGFASGVPAGTQYWSVWPGNQEDGFVKNSAASMTLYFESPKTAQEIEVYSLS